MATTKKVRLIEPVGDPRSGAILARGATVDLPEVWADRYVAQGKAELVSGKRSEPADVKPAKAKKADK